MDDRGDKQGDKRDDDPTVTPHSGLIDLLIHPRTRDLGDGFEVRRVLPFAKKRALGPFVFLDEMGPTTFAPGDGLDVRPHPHIGLATVTYLFDGEIRHRDSLGFDQSIRPGDVNWMTAGRGIVHSERTSPEIRARGQFLHGLQCWVALPEADAEVPPAFTHHPKETLPVLTRDDAVMRVIAGQAFGAASPVNVFSPLFYVAVEAEAGARVPLPDDYDERGVYLVSGAVEIDRAGVPAHTLAVVRAGAKAEVCALAPSRFVLLGGAPIGPRLLWWNFVATRDERLARAKNEWRQAAAAEFQGGAFSLPPGETEFIPLPND